MGNEAILISNKEKETRPRKTKAKSTTLADAMGVKLRYNENKTGTKSLYLDIHRNGKRYKEYLGKSFLLIGNTIADKETVRVAKSIMEERAIEIREQGVSVLSTKSRADVFTWLSKDIGKRKQGQSLLKHFKAFLCVPALSFRAIDGELVRTFQEYILTQVGANSTRTYMALFRGSIRRAAKQGYLHRDPFVKVDIVKATETERTYLTIEELKQFQEIYNKEKHTLSSNETLLSLAVKAISIKRNYHEALRAFLFACFTGLRISDVQKLIWGDIRGNQITIRQTKTKGLVTIPIDNQAMQYICVVLT